MTSSQPHEEEVQRRLVQLLAPYQRQWSTSSDIGCAVTSVVLLIPFVVFWVHYDYSFSSIGSILWRGLGVDVLIFIVYVGIGMGIESMIASNAVKSFDRAFPPRKKEERQMAIDILNQVPDSQSLERKMLESLPEVRLNLYKPISSTPEQEIQRTLEALSPESSSVKRGEAPKWSPSGKSGSTVSGASKPKAPARKKKAPIQLDTGLALDKGKKKKSRLFKLIKLEPQRSLKRGKQMAGKMSGRMKKGKDDD